MTDVHVSEGVGAEGAPTPSLWTLARVFLGISLLGFGGPAAHLALMLDEVVERKGWLTREQFLELMAVTNLLPGPNSSEVAIHIGYTLRGWRGALTTGLAFLLPTFFMVTGLAALYFRYGTLPQVEAIFWGVQPVVVAIVLAAGVKIGRAAVRTPVQGVLALFGALVSLASGVAVIPAMIVGGLVTGRRSRGAVSVFVLGQVGGPAAAGALATGAGPLGVLATVFFLHLGIGSVLFGGGYVLVALLEPFAVGTYGWLDAGQFLDGVALTQAVPGPISTLSAFVGYAAAGVPGAILGTLGVYLPAFAAVLFTAPRLERLREVEPVKRALSGVVAVAAGAVLGVGGGLAAASIDGWVTAALAALALVAAVWKKVPALWLVAFGVGAGMVRALLL